MPTEVYYYKWTGTHWIKESSAFEYLCGGPSYASACLSIVADYDVARRAIYTRDHCYVCTTCAIRDDARFGGAWASNHITKRVPLVIDDECDSSPMSCISGPVWWWK